MQAEEDSNVDLRDGIIANTESVLASVRIEDGTLNIDAVEFLNNHAGLFIFSI